jgi:hypothetical protein
MRILSNSSDQVCRTLRSCWTRRQPTTPIMSRLRVCRCWRAATANTSITCPAECEARSIVHTASIHSVRVTSKAAQILEGQSAGMSSATRPAAALLTVIWACGRLGGGSAFSAVMKRSVVSRVHGATPAAAPQTEPVPPGLRSFMESSITKCMPAAGPEGIVVSLVDAIISDELFSRGQHHLNARCHKRLATVANWARFCPEQAQLLQARSAADCPHHST